MTAQAQLGHPAEAALNRPAVQRQRARPDLDPVDVRVRRLRRVAERQGARSAPAGVHRLALEAADRQRQLRAPRDRHRYREPDLHRDRLPRAVRVAAHRAAGDRRGVHRGRRGRGAVHLVARRGRDRMAPQAQSGHPAEAALDRPRVQRQRARPDLDSVGVHIGALHHMPERQGLGPAPPQVRRLHGRGPNLQRQLRAARHLHRDVEADRHLDELARSVGVPAGGRAGHPRRTYLRRRRVGAVHLVANGCRDRVRAQRQRCGRSHRARNRSAVQRQRARSHAEAIRVHIRRLNHVLERQALGAAAAPIGGLHRRTPQRQLQLRRPRDRHRQLEPDVYGDRLAGAVGVAAPWSARNRQRLHSRTDGGAPVHPVVAVVRDRMTPQAQIRIGRGNAADAAPVQRQGPRCNADAVGVQVAPLHAVREVHRLARRANQRR